MMRVQSAEKWQVGASGTGERVWRGCLCLPDTCHNRDMSEPTQGRSRSYDSWSLVTRILKRRICAYRVLWSTPSFLLLFFLLFSLYSVLFPYFVSAFLYCFGKCMSCLLFGSFVGVVLCENCLTLFGSSLKFKKKTGKLFWETDVGAT